MRAVRPTRNDYDGMLLCNRVTESAVTVVSPAGEGKDSRTSENQSLHPSRRMPPGRPPEQKQAGDQALADEQACLGEPNLAWRMKHGHLPSSDYLRCRLGVVCLVCLQRRLWVCIARRGWNKRTLLLQMIHLQRYMSMYDVHGTTLARGA